MRTYDYIVIGGGIVGCSTAYHLGKKFPRASVLLVEKENAPGQHQTGRNSGVIHSGIYYKPGSFKAKFAKAGACSMIKFCKEHGIKYKICGKVIVACNQSELPLLESLYQRGVQNAGKIEKISHEQVHEIEPYVKCIAGILVRSTGITNYTEVTNKLIELMQLQNAHVEFSQQVEKIDEFQGKSIIYTKKAEFMARYLINCGGLYSDRIARMSGSQPGVQIVPFRGEYYELVPSKRRMVNTLIYPVPNPQFPFLGVHFTRMIDGSVHAGPNAVLAFKREGYNKYDINGKDLREMLAFAGLWKLIGRNYSEGMKEIHRSAFKSAFVKSLQKLIPEIQSEDLITCKSGVRAQALYNNGNLADDFIFIERNNKLHVCNAPSPAATASIEIGKAIVSKIKL